jgi:hypothetical protein
MIDMEFTTDSLSDKLSGPCRPIIVKYGSREALLKLKILSVEVSEAGDEVIIVVE